MAVNRALLLALKSLILVQEAMHVVQIALNNNPDPDEALELHDLLADLQTLKDELTATVTALENGKLQIPPPEPALLEHVKRLSASVEQAAIAGVTANAALGVAGQVMSAGLAVMSLAK